MSNSKEQINPDETATTARRSGCDEELVRGENSSAWPLSPPGHVCAPLSLISYAEGAIAVTLAITLRIGFVEGIAFG